MTTAADPSRAPLLQVEHSSVDSEWEAIRETFILAITNANERVWISSPYFVPDQGLYDALDRDGALGRRRPAHHDRVARQAHRVLGGDVVLRAVPARRRPRVPVHGRLLPPEDDVARLAPTAPSGPTNFDTRSLQLHSEMTVWVFDARRCTALQDALFERDLASSREVTLADVHAYSAADAVPQLTHAARGEAAVGRRRPAAGQATGRSVPAIGLATPARCA